MNNQTSLKYRIIGSMIPQFKGKQVCVLGEVADPGNATGMSFKMKTTDNSVVLIQLREQIQEYLDGFVEVHGVVKSEKLISCTNYVLFPQEYSHNFDKDQYNEAVKLTQRRSDLYTYFQKE